MALLLESERAQEFIRLLRGRVKEKTVIHCVRSAELMLICRDEAGITELQALHAGLLHDLCKGMSDSELLHAAQEYGISVSEVQRRRPKLLHGPVAAEECRRQGWIADDGVYEAIFWHTTGRRGLGPVGRALYLADFAEVSRTIPEAAQARAILEAEGFRKALLFASKEKAAYVRSKDVCDPNTEAFHRWLETEWA